MLNFNSIMIGSAQPQLLADFYQKVFQKPADMEEENAFSWQMGETFFTIGEHSQVVGQSQEPDRILLNFQTDQVKEEFDRIKSLGGVVVKEPYEMEGMWIATLSDPDGNYFQLMSPWPEDQ